MPPKKFSHLFNGTCVYVSYGPDCTDLISLSQNALAKLSKSIHPIAPTRCFDASTTLSVITLSKKNVIFSISWFSDCHKSIDVTPDIEDYRCTVCAVWLQHRCIMVLRSDILKLPCESMHPFQLFHK